MPRDGLDLWRFERGLDERERALATDPQRALDALSKGLSEWRAVPRGRQADALAAYRTARSRLVEEIGHRARA